MSNPFFHGNPTPPDRFVNRRRELRRIASRIANQGQSTAIIGEPRSGKTSLLLYLLAPGTRAELYGESGKQLLFSYLDAQTLGGEFSQAQFWQYGLCSLHEGVIAREPDSALSRAYDVCRENDFGCFVLERLLAQVGIEGWRLVLLLDEFDVLLHHPVLNSAEFFGSLRSLASCSRGALALVVASRRPLTNLNKDTQQFSRAGSPYFNFLDEITLGPLPDKYVTELLRWAGDRFTTDDRRFIARVAGGHPYLLQVTASEVWEAYAEGRDDPSSRWQQAGQNLYDKVTLILDDVWRLSSPATRKALAVVALADVSKMLRQRQFYTLSLIQDMRDFGPELRSLKKQGFIAMDETVPGGWRVRPQAFLWWLADELVRTVRDEMPFEEWLHRQELGFLMTSGEKEQMGKVVHEVGKLLKDGATTLIETAARGVGDAMVRGI